MGTPLVQRPRRLRRSAALREMVGEVSLAPARWIQPLFVVAGRGVERPIHGLAEQRHLSPDRVAAAAAELQELGIGGVLLFGQAPRAARDPSGRAAWDPDGPVPQAIAAVKQAAPDLVVAADVCLCAYVDHGHCGIVRDGRVDNDLTLPALARAAVCYARAGADVVAPSDMMDGRVAALRAALDGEGLVETAILSYTAKYASVLYGPFREAEDSAPAFGDRRTYQMDPRNGREALREAALDAAEGADLLMVKPALWYLDVVRALAARADRPVLAYQVSGEWAMLHAAAAQGAFDLDDALLESLTALGRAGAAAVVTYGAARAARALTGRRRALALAPA
jgi:porphobilinogen synthase